MSVGDSCECEGCAVPVLVFTSQGFRGARLAQGQPIEVRIEGDGCQAASHSTKLSLWIFNHHYIWQVPLCFVHKQTFPCCMPLCRTAHLDSMLPKARLHVPTL